MNRYILAAALCLLPLTACTNLENGPQNVANATVLDEQIATGVEKAATAVTKLGNAAAANGTIDKERYKALSRDLRAAVVATRTAYDAGNAGNLTIAAAKANQLVEQIGELVN